MPRSERGREKAATFSSLQNGWGPGESSSEQRGRSASSVPLRGGLGDSAGISPLVFLLFNNALCPVSRLSVRTNDIQLCCQCTRGSTGPPCWGKAASRLWLPHRHSAAPRRAAWSILMCHPASVLSLLMPPEGSKCRSESEPVISLSIWSRSVSTAEIGCLHFDGGG